MTRSTVIGVWDHDQPVPVGGIEGDHHVHGGEGTHFPGGLWAVSVDAPDLATAETTAIEILRTGIEETPNA